MKVLDFDPITNTTTYFQHDSINQKNLITYSQDIEPIIEQNKRAAEHFNKKAKYWHVGTVPDVLIMQWAKECGHKPFSKEWQEYAKKQLDSSEYRKFNQNKIKIGKRIKWE